MRPHVHGRVRLDHGSRGCNAARFELAEIESSLLEGRSGVSLVTRFPTEDYPSRIAAQIGEIASAPRL